jgi:GcrA cell cycle regulator
MKLSIWTEPVTARLVELYRGESKVRIGLIAPTLNAEFGIALSTRSVESKIERVNKVAGIQVVSPWTDAVIARLKELYLGDAQPPYQAIAETLNAEFGTAFTRNAMTGRVNRLKLANRKCSDGELAVVPRMPRAKKSPRVSQPRQRYDSGSRRILTIFAAVDAPELRLLPLEPRAPGLSIIDLEKNDCRWPVSSEEEQHFFCGHPQHAGSSYCFSHSSIAKGNGTSSERAAARVAA